MASWELARRSGLACHKLLRPDGVAPLQVCHIKGGWALPAEPAHCARQPVDELPTRKYGYYLRLPGKQYHLAPSAK
jgi:hypothetical protein